MPLVRITLPESTPAAGRDAIATGVHDALVATANVPADDRFQIVEAVPAGHLHANASYLGIERDAERVVIVQVFLNRGRTVDVKRALYARMARNLEAAGVRPQDLVVSLVEVGREDWSFGNGAMSYPPAP
jgi:4-oxalocrotonate tautomerase